MPRWIVYSFAGAWGSYLASIVWAAIVLPEPALVHVLPGLRPGASGRAEVAATSLWLGVVVLVAPLLFAWLLTRGSGRYVRMLFRDFWFAPPNVARLRRLSIENGMLASGVAGLSLFVANVATVAANLLSPSLYPLIVLGVSFGLTPLWVGCVVVIFLRLWPSSADLDAYDSWVASHTEPQDLVRPPGRSPYRASSNPQDTVPPRP